MLITTKLHDDIGNRPGRGGVIVPSVIVFLAMGALSLKIKTPGIAAWRPLHYTGLGILFLCFIWMLPSFRRRLESLSRAGWVLLALFSMLYVSVFLHTLGEPIRSMKDFLTGAIIDFGLLIVLLGVQGSKGKGIRSELYITTFCWIFVCFAVWSLVFAWFMYYGFEFSLGALRIGHNVAWGARLHGIQGEPTHLGAAMGLGAISGLFLYERSEQGAKQIFLLMLLVLMGATVFAAGSRNSLLSFLVAGGLMMIFSRARVKLLIGIALSFFGGLLAMMLIVDVLGGRIQSGLMRVELAYEKEHQQTLNKERSESSRHLTTAFRLGEPSAAISERTERIRKVTATYLHAPLTNKLMGFGYGALEYGLVATSFNSYLDTAVRFGMIHLILSVFFLGTLAYRLYKCVKINFAERDLAIFGLVILGYAVIFAVNMSTLFAVFFHIGTFCFVIAIATAIFCESVVGTVAEPSL